MRRAAIGVLLAAVVFAPVPGRSRGIEVLHDSAHGVIFGLVAILLLTLGRGRVSGGTTVSSRYARAFFVATALGAATELAQLATGRDASWVDMRTDALGVLTFLSAFAVFDRELRGHRRERRLRVIALLLSVSVAAILAAPLVTAATAYAKRTREFPALAEFGGWPTTYFIGAHGAGIRRAVLPAPWAVEAAEPALRVVFDSGDAPGLDLFEPAPDWRGYHSLAVDLTNPTNLPLAIVLRVHDGHRRAGKPAPFERHWQVPARTRLTLRVPLDQVEAAPGAGLMDLQHMAGVIINGTAQSEAREFYLSRIWLEK